MQEALIYSDTNIGGYFFDCYISIKHSSKLNITSHSVETGASIVDHAYLQPREVDMKIMVSNASKSRKSGQFSDGSSRSVSAFGVLASLQYQRIPISVFTKYTSYSNMLISELTIDDNADNAESMEAEVKLQEIPVATLKTAVLVNNSGYSKSTSSGSPLISAATSQTMRALNAIRGKN